MDTIMIIRDSVATCVKGTAEVFQPCKATGTKWENVFIVGIICFTVLVIAVVAICSYYAWKNNERKVQKEAEERKWTHEKEERELRINTDKVNYETKLVKDEKDHELKRKEELQDKLLNYIERRITEGETIVKDDKYIAKLNELINKESSPEPENEERA